MKQRQIAAPSRRRMAEVAALVPTNADELHHFVAVMLRLRMPRRALLSGNAAPLEYLVHAYFEGGTAKPLEPQAGNSAAVAMGEGANTSGGDCVVWACRGGGKTMLGAVATLLDLLFKPGIQVRILGGSLEQSGKMYRYLRGHLDSPLLRGVVVGEPTQRRMELVNGSAVEILSQSQRSVRGTRVHKLRCDEVDLFETEIWEAAQLVTRSGRCGDWWVRGSIEALSTAHKTFGLMSRLVDGGTGGSGFGYRVSGVAEGSESASATAETRHPRPETRTSRLFRWNALDIMGRCPRERPCTGCKIESDCQGLGKRASGFMPVEDVLTQRQRSGDELWATEMLCRRPRRSANVYFNFHPPLHVGSARPAAGKSKTILVGGMDFGMRSPLVMLYAQLQTISGAEPMNWPLHILAEYHAEGLTLEQHLRAIAARGWEMPAWIGVDPAGGQRNSQTGCSDIQVLKRLGYKVRARSSFIRDGVRMIRRRLDQRLLTIAPDCRHLIRAMIEYHFNADNQESENPVKDGPDHAADALRYLVVNLEAGGKAEGGNYL